MSIKQTQESVLRWLVARPRTSGLLASVMLFTIVLFIAGQRFIIIQQNDEREMENLLEAIRRNVTQSLQNSYTTALSVALLVNDQGQPENFDEFAGRIMANSPRVDAIQLVPDGVIRYVYPYESNKEAIGLNVMAEPELQGDAERAIRENKFFFAGPLELRQGGIGIVGRLPVYIKDKFWGFSAVIIKLETLVDASGIKNIDQSKYYFQFSRYNPKLKKEEYFLKAPENFSKNKFLAANVADSDWKLYIVNRQRHSAFWQVLPIGIFGGLLAVAFGFIISFLLKQPAALREIVQAQAKRLEGSETRYKTIFDQAAVGIAYVDSNSGQVLEANRQLAAMLDLTPEEVKGTTMRTYTHPDDVDRNDQLLKDMISGRINSFQMEKRYITRDRKTIWANITVVPIQLNDRQSPTHISVVEDITMTKLAQEKIKESEARFKSLFEDMPVALWEEDFSAVKEALANIDANQTDEDLLLYFENNIELVNKCMSLVRVVDVNNKCLKYHAPKTKEDLLKGLGNVLDSHSVRVFIMQLIAIVKGRTQLWGESAMAGQNGEVREFALRWSVIRGYETNYERVIIYGEDITLQKEAERIRLAAQQKMQNIVNTIDGIVWECDAETHKLHFISRKTEEILGYTVDEWFSDENFWSNHIHPDDRAAAVLAFKQTALTREEDEFEYRMISKHGELVWIRDIVSAHTENDQVILRGIMIDITKHKEANADLSHTLDLVNEQKKRLMNFSYIVSHNLRSHNANIQSIINLVQDSDSEQERDELIGHLKTVSDSLDQTMQHLNDLVNIQSNISLVTEPLHINHYVENTKKILSELIAARQVTVINNIPQNALVNYNAAYLESIILNLISNGIRYSHPDRKPLIVLDWQEDDRNYILKVRDNGLGIDMKRYGDKLFGMYKTFHGNPEARGVGLFMTRNQVEAMGGQITVESEPGKGSTFSVYFKK